jgi:hypothetical protein
MLKPLKPKNRRLSVSERQARESRQRRPDVARNPVRQAEAKSLGIKFWLGIIVLTPIALVTAVTMVEMSMRLIARDRIMETEEFRFFCVGFVAWLAVYYAARVRPVRLYVFGHELSHALVAWCLGAKIYRFEFNSQGGYVETNKSNTFISLAPYFLPIYALAVMLSFGVVALFTDLSAVHTVEVFGVTVPFKLTRLFYIALGLTWGFHVTYTVLTLRSEQSDLTRNDEYFSLMLIFLVNAGLLILMLVSASPHPELGMAQTMHCWTGVASRWLLWFL